MRVILYAFIVKGIIILSLFVFTKSGGKSQKDIKLNDTPELKVKINGEGNPILLVPGGLTGGKALDLLEISKPIDVVKIHSFILLEPPSAWVLRKQGPQMVSQSELN